MEKTLSARIATLLLATHLGTPAAAYFRANQLLEIENIVPDNNWVVLRRYVFANPELPEGAVVKMTGPVCAGIVHGITSEAEL